MDSQNLEKGQLPSYQDISKDAKEKIDSRTPAALEEGRPSSAPASAPAKNMTSYRRTILFLSFTWLVLYGVALAGENRLRWQKGSHKAQVPEQQSGVATGSSTEPSSFAALLNGASPKSLHDLLHRHLPKRFQDGVWESEHHAVRAVHQADPALASTIVQLAKRQDNNSTAASTTEDSSSTTPSTSATTPSTRPTPTGTPSPTPTNTPTTIASTTSTTSTTSRTSAPPTGTLSEPAESRSSPAPSGSSGSSSSGVSSFSSPSRLVSSVVDGETTLTTSTLPDPDESTSTPPPTRTSRSIVTTFTRTSNGNVVTITSTTFVDAEPETTGSPETSTRATPGLQNSAPKQQQGSLLAGVIAVMGMLMV
ncbi:hypothetical protein QBC44DRAFT_315112 [Cladorrhinum sp. PSN332]|nr:hypothetical protein QBC44DRAFT_315112 [Cladorrhinum sp. PSN332]